MMQKRIIACLDVRGGKVVKGVQFKNHRDIGCPVELAKKYSNQGVDELVFYDIGASSDKTNLNKSWISDIAKEIDIPFCVAGGISSVEKAKEILEAGADKVSLNSPAIRNPELIASLALEFGSQCVVVGIDSKLLTTDGQLKPDYRIHQYTGREHTTESLSISTESWIRRVCELGAGEVVLNCMSSDGMKNGYDVEQLKLMRKVCTVPLIASGGAGRANDFASAFLEADVDGCLAASIFHDDILPIPKLKQELMAMDVPVRPGRLFK